MHLQVATEQVTKTIEGRILAATLGEGGITRAMHVRPLFPFPALLSFPFLPFSPSLSCLSLLLFPALLFFFFSPFLPFSPSLFGLVRPCHVLWLLGNGLLQPGLY